VWRFRFARYGHAFCRLRRIREIQFKRGDIDMHTNMSRWVLMGMLVTAVISLTTGSTMASAQGRDNSVNRQVMVYYAVPFGARNRVAREPVLGFKLETVRPRFRSRASFAATPPEVDLQFSLRSGMKALKLQGQDMYRYPGTLNQDAGEGQDPDPEINLGVIISLGLAIAGAGLLISKAKKQLENCSIWSFGDKKDKNYKC
jgi:hypothetical protein